MLQEMVLEAQCVMLCSPCSLELLLHRVTTDPLTFQEDVSEIQLSMLSNRSDCSQQYALDALVSLSGFSLGTCM